MILCYIFLQRNDREDLTLSLLNRFQSRLHGELQKSETSDSTKPYGVDGDEGSEIPTNDPTAWFVFIQFILKIPIKQSTNDEIFLSLKDAMYVDFGGTNADAKSPGSSCGKSGSV